MRASRRGRGGVVDLAMRMGGVNALLGWETDTFPYTRMRTEPVHENLDVYQVRDGSRTEPSPFDKANGASLLASLV